MILIDSNIFVIDRFFRNDAVYPANRALIERLHEFEAAVSIFTLLETCGIASFNLSAKECETWLRRFHSLYRLSIISGFGIANQGAEDWLKDFVRRVTVNIVQRMSFGDAVLLAEAESHNAEAIITWNTKDFNGRSGVPVFSPKSFLGQYEK